MHALPLVKISQFLTFVAPSLSILTVLITYKGLLFFKWFTQINPSIRPSQLLFNGQLMPKTANPTLSTKHLYFLVLASMTIALGIFDFWAFWYMATLITQAILIQPNTWQSAAIILVSYLSCPLGAWIIGRYVHHKGFKAAVSLSLTLSMAGAALLAILPTALLPPLLCLVLVIIARLAQGMALGAQLPMLWIYASAFLPKRHTGIGCGLLTAAMVAGGVTLFLLINLLETMLTPIQFYQYGWRIPFLIGATSAATLFIASRNLDAPTLIATAPSAYPRWQTLPPVLVLSWLVISVLLILVLLLEDLIHLIVYIHDGLLTAGVVTSWVFLMIGCVFFGFLSDNIGNTKTLRLGVALLMVMIFGLFYDLMTGGRMLVLSFALTGFASGVIGAAPALMARLSLGQSLSFLTVSYNLLFVLTALIAPLALGFFAFAASLSPALYISFICLITLFTTFFIAHHPQSERHQ